MKIATRTLATILIVSMLAFSTMTALPVSATDNKRQKTHEDKKLQRMYQHHDRKMELRAEVIGVSPEQLREELKAKPFDQVIKKHGFKSREAFHVAVAGKLKDELKRRGWNEDHIKRFFEKRATRLGITRS